MPPMYKDKAFMKRSLLSDIPEVIKSFLYHLFVIDNLSPAKRTFLPTLQTSNIYPIPSHTI